MSESRAGGVSTGGSVCSFTVDHMLNKEPQLGRQLYSIHKPGK